MNIDTNWPAYLISRAIAQPPADCFVIDGTTPVIAFGDPVKARVATLGINPSRNEFLDPSGTLLVGKRRRLATLESLNLGDRTTLNEGHGASVLDGCADYFKVRSYAWFKPLNYILNESIHASYGTDACHLDLVQWATNPVWRALDKTIRSRLLDDGVGFLNTQLATEEYELVIVNGRTVMNAVEAAGITSWISIGPVLQNPTTHLYEGRRGSQRFLSWSCNLQSQPGARRHIDALVDFVKTNAGFNMPRRDLWVGDAAK
jgi:hypothetical protein